jgi:hypothetical protein
MGEAQGVADLVESSGAAVIVRDIPSEVHGRLVGIDVQYIAPDIGP